MRFQNQLRLRLRSLFARNRQESELEEELRFHLEKEAERNLARGVAGENAQREALREFGRVIEIKQQCREARGTRIFDELIQDIRYACCRRPAVRAHAK
jgi:putative ABC transport system permease protein